MDRKKISELGVVTHVYNSRSWETKIREQSCEFDNNWIHERVLQQPGPDLEKNQKKKKKKKRTQGEQIGGHGSRGEKREGK